MSTDLDAKLGAELLIKLDSLLKQGKNDTVLLLFNAIADKMLSGGWRGECSFLVDEFNVRKVQFEDGCNLDLLREEYREALGAEPS